MSLDGVIDAPTWTFDYGYDPKMGEAIAASMDGCTGILLGRTTYEMFEPAWSQRTVEDDPGAPFFNDTMKYVVSGTLTTATWRNSQILGPYDAEAIRRLKNEVGDLYVSGSGTLVRALIADGLADELHLFVYPLTRGSGAAPPQRRRGTAQALARRQRVIRERRRLPLLQATTMTRGKANGMVRIAGTVSLAEVFLQRR
jgi:dihydrofolate reductase